MFRYDYIQYLKMAQSGITNKVSDLSGSLSRGSAEAVDYACDPCLTTGHQADAHKYCMDCKEYLCRNCSDCHLRTKASRNHQLLDKDNVGKQPSAQGSDVCDEKCTEHKQEVIKCLCPQHEVLGCHICMIMYHKTCEVDYIPDKCKDISNSDEYKKTVLRLNLKLQELDKITKTSKLREQQIDECHHNLLQEIIKFRKEINDYLDQLQQKIQREVDKKKTEDKQITQRILDGCNRLSSDIKKMQSTMQAYETSGKYGQLYIKIQQAQPVLRTDGIKAGDGLERIAQQYIFERNNSLLDMLRKQDALGNLNLTTVLETPRKKMKTLYKLIRKEDINIRTKSDKFGCWITGCGVLTSEILVLADNSNEKLKLVNINTKSVVEETLLDSAPWGVVVLSPDKIAVTVPRKRQVVIKTCGDKLSSVDTISVTGGCYGITYHHDQLYVVCQNDPLCVLILDNRGNRGSVLKRMSLNNKIFSGYFIEVSENPKLLYLSDCIREDIVSVTFQGEVSAVYKCKNFEGPRGMLMLNE